MPTMLGHISKYCSQFETPLEVQWLRLGLLLLGWGFGQEAKISQASWTTSQNFKTRAILYQIE